MEHAIGGAAFFNDFQLDMEWLTSWLVLDKNITQHLVQLLPGHSQGKDLKINETYRREDPILFIWELSRLGGSGKTIKLYDVIQDRDIRNKSLSEAKQLL